MITVIEQMQRIDAGETNPYANLQAVREELFDLADDEEDPVDMDFNVEVIRK